MGGGGWGVRGGGWGGKSDYKDCFRSQKEKEIENFLDTIIHIKNS